MSKPIAAGQLKLPGLRKIGANIAESIRASVGMGAWCVGIYLAISKEIASPNRKVYRYETSCAAARHGNLKLWHVALQGRGEKLQSAFRRLDRQSEPSSGGQMLQYRRAKWREIAASPKH